MKIAVASSGLEVASYYERCTNLNCFIADNELITNYRNLPLLETQRANIPLVLAELEIDLIIVGCVSKPSRAMLEETGVALLEGAQGDAKLSVEAYLTDTFVAFDDSCAEYGIEQGDTKNV
jgi:predicted Fe-Mo cluster-binding NifX family protein